MSALEHLSETHQRQCETVTALGDFAWTIEEGAWVAIPGPTGGGKSSLLQVPGALDRPDTGSVLFGDSARPAVAEPGAHSAGRRPRLRGRRASPAATAAGSRTGGELGLSRCPVTTSATTRPPWIPRYAPVLLALSLALTGCGSASGTTPAAQSPDPTVTNLVIAELEDDLQDLATEVPGVLGVVLVDAHGGDPVTLNADRSFTSASLYKLFVACAVLEKVDQGIILLSDPVPGSSLTVQEALEAMITWSDNVSGAALGTWIGWQQVQDVARQHGFESTTFDPDTAVQGMVDMTTTPDDVADLLQQLGNNDLLSAWSTELLQQYLGDQQLNYALSTGLSRDVSFAHKTGLLEDVSHDAGILQLGDHQYIVAVLTDGWNGYEESTPWFQEMGEALNTYVHDDTAS